MSPQRRSPDQPVRATSTTPLASRQFTPPWHHDHHEPPTPEDRADAAVVAAAAARGFRLATRCLRCGQWLVAAESVRTHLGPVCRAKAVADA